MVDTGQLFSAGLLVVVVGASGWLIGQWFGIGAALTVWVVGLLSGGASMWYFGGQQGGGQRAARGGRSPGGRREG